MEPFAACPQCQHRVRVKPDVIGRKVRCPRCQAIFRVVDQQAAAEKSNVPIAVILQPEAIPLAQPVTTLRVGDHVSLSREMPGPCSEDLATASPQLVVDANGLELLDESFAGHSSQQSVYEQYAQQLLRRSSGQHASSVLSRVTAANADYAPSFGALPADSSPLIWDQGVRTGMFLIAFGLATAFLPSVGLQFKALAWLGGYAPMAGVTIGGLGALLVFFSMIGSPIKAVALSGLASVMLVAVGLGIPWARAQLGWTGAPLTSTATERENRWISRALSRSSDSSLPATQPSTSSAAPFPSTSGFPPAALPPPDARSPYSPPPSSTPTDGSKPAYQWRDTVLPGFPCRAEFPLPTQTRWDTMMVDGVPMEFVEHFCELASGIRLALGGAERSSEESRRASAEALRAGVLKKLSAEHGISSSNFHLKVSGDPRPFLELSGAGAKGGQVIRLRAASSDSMLMWASINGPPQWAGDNEPQRFFGSVDFGGCEQGRADEVRLWLAASKHFASSHRGTSVASQSPAPATANPLPTLRVPRTFEDFLNDNSMSNLFGNELEGGTLANAPEILDQADAMRKRLIEARNQQLASTAQRAIGEDNNPLGNEYLSPLVGQSGNGNAIKVYHRQRLPMIGVDFTLDRTRRQLTAIGPIYSRSTAHRVLARNGFAVAGLKIYEEQGAIRGLQFMFMKVRGAGFDANEAYWSEWFGFPPNDESLAVKLAGDGRPVYGLYYFERASVLCGLGLVVEKAR